MKKILLFKIGAIGDVVMTTPLLRQLRKNYPDAQIDYAVGKSAAGVLHGNKNVDDILVFEANKKVSSFLGFLRFIGTIRRNKYDAVFVFDRHWILNVVSSLFGAKERIGFDRQGKEGVGLTRKVFFDGSKHEIQYYFDLGKVAGAEINYKDVKPDVFISKQDEKYAESIFKKLGKNVICISPGGAKNPGQSISLKLWPKENYAELIKNIIKNNHVILVGDKNDAETGDFIVNSIESKNLINMIGKTTIQETAAIMNRTKMVVCNDTGPMHIASAVNDDVISIFGPTDPKRFAPLNKKSTYLWKGTVCNDIYGSFALCKGVNYTEKISVHDVLEAIKKTQ